MRYFFRQWRLNIPFFSSFSLPYVTNLKYSWNKYVICSLISYCTTKQAAMSKQYWKKNRMKRLFHTNYMKKAIRNNMNSNDTKYFCTGKRLMWKGSYYILLCRGFTAALVACSLLLLFTNKLKTCSEKM